MSDSEYQHDSREGSIKEKDQDVPITPPNEQQESKDEGITLPPAKASYLLVTMLCCFLAMGGFVFGYDTGTISGYINMPQFLEKFGSQHDDGTYYLSKVRSGLLVGIFSIGAAIGGLSSGRVADTYGRKRGIMVGAAIYIVGNLIQITAVDKWYQYFIGRIIGGIGIGGLSVICPMFQSETAPKEIRGTLVASFQLFITLGIFIGYCVCYGTNDRDDTGAYRIPLGLCFAWSLILLIGTIFMPESPRFLLTRDRYEEALQAMCFINQREREDPLIKETMDEITAAIEHEREVGSAGWNEVFTGQPRIGYRLFVGATVQALQQLCGANYFFYYGTTIFKAIGMEDSFATSMIFGAVNFVSTFASFYVVDRFGRRKCLFWGAVAMFIFFIIYASLGTAALYPHEYGVDADQQVGKGMIAVTCFFIFSFAVSWAPIAYIYCSEIYPLRVKSKCMGIATGANWLGNFLLSFFTPFITGAINFRYGYVFSGCLAFSIFFVFFFVNETKGLTLEQIDQMYAARVVPWRSENYQAELQNAVQPSHKYFHDQKAAQHSDDPNVQ
uniref:ARAD1B23166p n=1 Tax=Blastobotrys adeninivorans TaxID=409370 RepID=A0A060TDA9_BLAAD